MSHAIGERQTIWGWKVAMYLFLAGMGAGAYLTGVAAQFAGDEWAPIFRTGVTIGIPVVALSTLLLIWDLGRPFAFYRAGFRPKSSWISRGVLILTVFIPLGLVHVILAWVESPDVIKAALGVAGGLLAVLTMVYTGFLLGAVRPIPFWSTPVLPLIFLVSASSTGIMGVSLGLSIYVFTTGNSLEEGRRALLTADSTLLVIEVLLIFSYLYIVRASLAARASVECLLWGEMALQFWVGFVACGLLLPLTIELVQLGPIDEAGPGARMASTIFATVPGLIGGYILRQLVISAGVKSPLVVIGRVVPIPGKSRLLW